MDWHRRIDGYCERTGPEFWAEPVNAATNAAFLVAALVALALWAALADTGPISFFILSYFAIAMNRFAGQGRGRAIMLTLGFLLAMGLVSWALRVTVGAYMGGSQSYVPAALALLGVGLWLRGRNHPAGRWLLAAAGVFAVSLTFRTLDQPICDDWPTGTHFAWHLLNAVVLGTLTIAVIRHGRLPEGGASPT